MDKNKYSIKKKDKYYSPKYYHYRTNVDSDYGKYSDYTTKKPIKGRKYAKKVFTEAKGWVTIEELAESVKEYPHKIKELLNRFTGDVIIKKYSQTS